MDRHTVTHRKDDFVEAFKIGSIEKSNLVWRPEEHQIDLNNKSAVVRYCGGSHSKIDRVLAPDDITGGADWRCAICNKYTVQNEKLTTGGPGFRSQWVNRIRDHTLKCEEKAKAAEEKKEKAAAKRAETKAAKAAASKR